MNEPAPMPLNPIVIEVPEYRGLSLQVDFWWKQGALAVERPRIEIFLDNPPSRLERGHEARKYLLSLWNMNEHQAGVNQIKSIVGKWVSHDVVSTNLKIRQLVDETRIKIRYQHISAGTNAFRQPRGD